MRPFSASILTLAAILPFGFLALLLWTLCRVALAFYTSPLAASATLKSAAHPISRQITRPYFLLGLLLFMGTATAGASVAGSAAPPWPLVANGDAASMANASYVLAGLAAIAAGIAGLRKLVGTRETPAQRELTGQPIRVTPEPVYVSEEEFRTFEREVRTTLRADRDAMHARFNELDRNREKSIGELHEKINDTAEGLRTKIDNVPGQLIALLKATGHLDKGGKKQ